ncbi:abhydrolase domain-containing protein 14a [Plakobranchus ocellatus]|uniref:Abhydrolase domain-containing protein 14a n=1 Tax=Plakobranchus ocellatus TaxID=259542 RepID=A0AAV3Z0T3_9GAST|nr:abhydrolase domain-containing protein 14a [Plakobranchus ocellatus]
MGGLRPSGLHLNKPVVFGLLGIALVVFVVTRLYMGGGLAGTAASGVFQIAVKSETKPPAAGRGMDHVVNASLLESPPAFAADAASQEEQFKITLGDKALNVHVVQMIRRKADVTNALTVLFLHGASFTSKNWLDIKTLEHVANWGYRAIAIDLPGYGTTDLTDESQPADFLTAFITAMGMKKVVIVSPSMSGSYSLPYLFKEPKSSTERAVGYVPVAPVKTGEFRQQYADSQLPTLIVYGTKDRRGDTTTRDLMLLPKHEVAPIDGAGHACYLDKPDDFHKVLFYFLKKLSS